MNAIQAQQAAQQLLADRQAALLEAKTILDAASRENRDLSDAEAAEVKALQQRARQLKDEWADASQGRISSPSRPPGSTAPTWSYPGTSDAPRHATGKRFAEMFGTPHGNDGFAGLGDFLASVNSGLFDNRLRPAATAFRGGVDSQGGFLIPPEYAAMMLDASLENEIIRPRCQVFPMRSDTLKIPGFDGKTHTNHLFGGLVASWTAELASPDATAAKMLMLMLKAKKLFILSQASNEVMADAPDFENVVGRAMIAALGFYLDESFLTGTGAGCPLGILNDMAKVTVAKEQSQADNTITYVNLVTMLARLHPALFKEAIWIASPSTVPQLLQLSIDMGSTSEHVPVLTSSAGRYELLHREVIFTKKLPALGNEGDLVLCAPSQYAVGLRPELGVEASRHAGFSDDSTWLRAIVRADGMGTWNAPVTPRGGGDTLSWIVTLADRLSG